MKTSIKFRNALLLSAGILLFTIRAESQPVRIDLKKLPEKRTVKLSEIGVTDIQYIPLETSEDCMIKSIRNVIFGKDFFLIQYFADINMFRYDGSFVTKIGTIGRGPNEFTIAHGADINPKTGSIYVADGFQQKFLVYNKNGKVLRTFKTPLTGPLSFVFTDDGILCYYHNHMGIVENSYILIDTLGSILRNFPNRYPWKRTVPNVIFLGENIFYRFNGNLLKKEIYTDTVYAYRNKGFIPNLIIDVGKLRLTPQIREKNDAKYIMGNFLTPMNLFEFGKYIYYEMVIPWEGETEGLSWIGSKDGKYSVLFDPETDLINDFDAGPKIWPRTVKDNSIMISWTDAINFKQHINSSDYKALNPTNTEKRKQLEKLAASVNETDNPIMMLIKIK
jgi:hypothetical protein